MCIGKDAEERGQFCALGAGEAVAEAAPASALQEPLRPTPRPCWGQGSRTTAWAWKGLVRAQADGARSNGPRE